MSQTPQDMFQRQFQDVPLLAASLPPGRSRVWFYFLHSVKCCGRAAGGLSTCRRVWFLLFRMCGVCFFGFSVQVLVWDV